MTPLVLTVGFLGSGKTTFLKNLLPRLAALGVEPGVIINDYQNAGVDAEQLRELTGAVEAISGDCVCCGSKDELLETLRKFEHRPGRVAIVETNGTTDSEQLIEMLSLEPDLHAFTLPVQLSVIDSQRWQKRFWNNSLEREQARTATHVFVSRADIVEPARLRQVEKTLEEVTKAAHVTVDAFAQELAALSQELRDTPSRHAGHHHHACDFGHEHHHHHEHDHARNHSEHHFASVELALPEKVSDRAFRGFLKDLPEEVIRAKGIVRFEEKPNELFIFQKVDRFDEPQFFPMGAGARITTPLALFIGPALAEPVLRAGIERLAP